MRVRKTTTKTPRTEDPKISRKFDFDPRVDISRFIENSDNPRLESDEELVQSLAASIRRFGFRVECAPLALPMPDDKLMILAGHRRIMAARLARYTRIPCWIAKRTLSAEEATMIPVTSNVQGGLTGLEIGNHALRTVYRAKGGRGRRGGLSAHARTLGLAVSTLSGLVRAAEVYDETKALGRPKSFLKRSQHLTLISKAPREQWTQLVKCMLHERWTVRMTREALAERGLGSVAQRAEGTLDEAELDSTKTASAGYHRRQGMEKGESGAAQSTEPCVEKTDSATPSERAAVVPYPHASWGPNGVTVTHTIDAASASGGDSLEVAARVARRGQVREHVTRFLCEVAGDLNCGEALLLVERAIPRLVSDDLRWLHSALKVILDDNQPRPSLGTERTELLNESSQREPQAGAPPPQQG